MNVAYRFTEKGVRAVTADGRLSIPAGYKLVDVERFDQRLTDALIALAARPPRCGFGGRMPRQDTSGEEALEEALRRFSERFGGYTC